MKHLPAEDKVVSEGQNVPDAAEAEKVQKRSVGDVLGAQEGNKTKREAHRGLKDLPDDEKVKLSGEGVGKDIDKPGVGVGRVGRVRRHLGRHVRGVRS